jgi:dihydrofolate reductase
MDEAFAAADKMDDVEKLFICGGAQIYKFSLPYMDGLYITHIKKTYDCDVFFPQIPAEFTKKEKLGEEEEDGVKLEFWLYTK